MSYKFKGIDISTITSTTGGSNTTDVHNFFKNYPPIVPSGPITKSRPYYLGFTESSSSSSYPIDISVYSTAAYNDYSNSTQTAMSIPTGVTHFRSILIGGGGGGGGNGGDAKATANVNGNSSNGNGGPGGPGETGEYCVVIDTPVVSNQNTIQVRVGTGGGAGANGGGNSISPKDLTKLPDSTKGSPGDSGNAGNSSFIIYNGFTHTAPGGAGGGGGGGATATVNSSSNTNSTSPGPATGYTRTTSTPETWPSLQGPYGIGGQHGINDNPQSASAGTAGRVRIIWLY